jgi:CBS domain containing-hemolysin-like protein
VARGVTRLLCRLLGVDAEGSAQVTREELRLLLERRESAEINEPEREMVRRIFEFPEVTVGDVMRPLIDITAIDEQATLEEAMATLKDSGFSRVPVYRERVDNVVGIVHSLDVVYETDASRRVASIMRPVTYVPPTQKVDQLLAELQRQRRGLAIVVDEYGGAEGLVTTEDILEEIVGEIDDEHDVPSAEIKRRGEKEWLVSARTPVERLNEEIGADVPEGDYETVSGFLLARLGRIPKPGDIVETEGTVVTVVTADARVVEDVQIVLKSAPGGPRSAG